MTDRNRKHMTSVGPKGKKQTGSVDQIIARYETLAKDEQDTVKAHQFDQHAEHYRRMKRK